jgi:hypothetical protein
LDLIGPDWTTFARWCHISLRLTSSPGATKCSAGATFRCAWQAQRNVAPGGALFVCSSSSAPLRLLPFVCSPSSAPLRLLLFVCSSSSAPLRLLLFVCSSSSAPLRLPQAPRRPRHSDQRPPSESPLSKGAPFCRNGIFHSFRRTRAESYRNVPMSSPSHSPAPGGHFRVGTSRFGCAFEEVFLRPETESGSQFLPANGKRSAAKK